MLEGCGGGTFHAPRNVVEKKIDKESKMKRQQTTAPALNLKERLEIKDFQNNMDIDLPESMDKFLNADDISMAKQESDPFGGQNGQQGRGSNVISDPIQL